MHQLWCFVIWIRGEVKCKCVFALHSRHVILFSFFSAKYCMGEPHRGRVELYLWGAAIGFGRSETRNDSKRETSQHANRNDYVTEMGTL